jgi:hypothetical protein
MELSNSGNDVISSKDICIYEKVGLFCKDEDVDEAMWCL